MKKTIGLSLAFKGTNYGALWQAYATQQKIEALGFDTEIVDYQKAKKHEYIHCPGAYYGYFSEKLKEKRARRKDPDPVLDAAHRENLEQRKQRAEEFRKNRLKNIYRVKGLDALRRHAEETYCAVLVGSDQIWQPTTAFTYIATLRYAPKEMRRISYATSLGVSEYPRYARRKGAQFWRTIDHLSTREQSGVDIIREVSGREAKLVLDPTYLLTKQEWEERVPREKVVEDGYVLSYLLGENPAMKRLAREYADARGLRLVCIMSNGVCVDDTDLADEVLKGRPAEDFINLIRFADCVFTDSFHGFAFSVINEKQVYVTYRVRKGTASRNTRIDNITQLFGLERRLIRDPANETPDPEPIDYERVNAILSEKRADSAAFLENALQGL